MSYPTNSSEASRANEPAARTVVVRRLLWGLVVPAIGLGVVMGVVAVFRPSAILGAATNPVVWAYLAGSAVLGALLGLASRGLRAPVWSSFALFWVPVLAVTGYGVLPVFVDSTVDEAAPTAITKVEPKRSGAGESAADGRDGAAERQADSAEGQADSAEEQADSAEEQADKGESARQAVELGRARVVGIDHEASGTAKVYDVAGRIVVRFENLDVEAGPDFRVWLVPGADAQVPGSGVDLGGLTANRGNQNYRTPDGTAVDGPATVLIWCRAFQVPVANATIS